MLNSVEEAHVLDLPLYSITEAGRLLGVRPVTLRRWLEGYEARGVAHAPIIRPEPTGSDAVTWGEFVEAGFLREYRKGVSLQRLRPLVDEMRKRFQVSYPLAHFKPAIEPSQRDWVLELQLITGIPDELALVQWRNQQLMWSDVAASFLHKVEFDPLDAVARRMFPMGKDVPVVIDPQQSFGVPQVRGVRTEVIAELVAAGESSQAVARMWGMDEQEVDAAVDWERQLKAA